MGGEDQRGVLLRVIGQQRGHTTATVSQALRVSLDEGKLEVVGGREGGGGGEDVDYNLLKYHCDTAYIAMEEKSKLYVQCTQNRFKDVCGRDNQTVQWPQFKSAICCCVNVLSTHLVGDCSDALSEALLLVAHHGRGDAHLLLRCYGIHPRIIL